MADRVNSLLADLKRLKVETGSLACLACGREHNCGVHGCAVLRKAADVLQECVDRCKYYAEEVMALREQRRWIPVTERLPETEDFVLAVVNGKPTENVTLVDSIEIASFMWDEGWCLDMYPEWEDPKVTHWMPLPDAPEVTCDG